LLLIAMASAFAVAEFEPSQLTSSARSSSPSTVTD
jgi:hypothetical protein